jgi:hypothetical protein
LPLPKLSDEQVQWVIQHVSAYIDRQRQTYGGRAVPLETTQLAIMRPFFPASSLNSARVVTLTAERIGNPPFYGELTKMGFKAGALPDFAGMAAITFVDTVVSHGPYNNRTLFHELIHVVQYEKLGLTEFAGKYVKGFLSGGSYEAIPLEVNAYELDARFAASPANPFSAEAQVQFWIDGDKF